MESVSKMMNGHSDTMLGALCGTEQVWQRVPQVVSTWGLASSPFDCYLAVRGLATLHLRMERACDNARRAAEYLAGHSRVARVCYPGLPEHPHHRLARRQFGDRFGCVVTFTLPGGRSAADAFIQAAQRIPFCPSLGEICTTLSHPQSTSHRSMTAAERAELGIEGGTIRLSLGCESAEFVVGALDDALRNLGA
jgi:cystathionine beta-lyase/cystathionine gamma-synthase